MKEITETMLLDNLVREAIQNPTIEQVEEYGPELVSKYFSKIGDLKVHWQYARYTNVYNDMALDTCIIAEQMFNKNNCY